MALFKETFISYDEYLKLKDENKKNLDYIDNKPNFPSLKHQLVLSNLHVEFGIYLKGTSSKVLAMPTRIQLPSNNSNDGTIVTPDLAIVSATNFASSIYIGVPHLIVEILDFNNQTDDLVTKFNLYMHYGVKEYWIVNPLKSAVTVYALNSQGLYEQTDIKVETGIIHSTIFKELKINLKDILHFPLH